MNTLTFIGFFWATMLFIALTYLCFFIAAYLRYRIEKLQYSRMSDDDRMKELTAPEENFRRRRTHIMIIALVLSYLRVVTLQVQAWRCASAPETGRGEVVGDEGEIPQHNYLIADLSTRCYEGAHSGTLAFVVITLLFYTAGFPIYILVVLRRAFRARVLIEGGGELDGNEADGEELPQQQGNRDIELMPPGAISSSPKVTNDTISLKIKRVVSVDGNETEDQRVRAALRKLRLESYGVLYAGLRNDSYLYKINQFPVSIWYAFVTVFLTETNQVPLALFLLGVSAFLQSILAIWTQPFVAERSNVFIVVTSVGTLLYTLILLLVQERSNNAPTYGYILIALFILCLLLIPFRNAARNFLGAAAKPMRLRLKDGKLEEIAADEPIGPESVPTQKQTVVAHSGKVADSSALPHQQLTLIDPEAAPAAPAAPTAPAAPAAPAAEPYVDPLASLSKGDCHVTPHHDDEDGKQTHDM